MRNRKKYLEYNRRYAKPKIEERRKFLLDFKKDKSCQICGYDEHTEILQFHHEKLDDKEFQIGVSTYGIPLERIKEEMKKCILICPNCHVWIHYKGRFEIDRKNKV